MRIYAYKLIFLLFSNLSYYWNYFILPYEATPLFIWWSEEDGFIFCKLIGSAFGIIEVEGEGSEEALS